MHVFVIHEIPDVDDRFVVWNLPWLQRARGFEGKRDDLLLEQDLRASGEVFIRNIPLPLASGLGHSSGTRHCMMHVLDLRDRLEIIGFSQ